ncbi:MAG: type I pantothenate kinase [Geodermatophilaceae bacterium]|nr:type I pantothenate kinase [Geodermatophilaceae bacterium]
MAITGDGSPSPFVTFDRGSWRSLAASTPLPLAPEEITRLRGLGDTVDTDEVATVYLPLSRLLNLYVATVQGLWSAQSRFLGSGEAKVPFVIAVAGSVAVGKSTTARILQALLSRWPDHPMVELVTTDGFLYSNEVLSARGLLHRKGFPETYDQRRLVRFLSEVKSGAASIVAPMYSHLLYDVVSGPGIPIESPDILILEGLNVLQSRARADGRVPGVFLSDFFDFSVFVDAAEGDIRRWYVERFLALCSTAFQDEKSYFHRYARLNEAEAVATAEAIWAGVNAPNLVQNIAPTRSRAKLILHKAADHSVRKVLLRKL